MLRLYLNGTKKDEGNLIGRVMRTCDEFNLSLVKTVCERHYIKNNFKQSFSKNDGLVNTIETLACNLNRENRNMINALLSPF